MSIIADTLLHYIADIKNIELGEARIDSFRLSYIPEKTDYDVGRVLNLLWELEDHELMAYPEYTFDIDTTNYRPMVLVVGDSYYWNIFNTRIPKNLFANEAFWYFYHEVYPENYFQPTTVENINLQEEVEKQNVIILTVTERFLYKFDWGFIDDLYNIYGMNSQLDLSYDFQAYIRKHSEWFDNVILDSKIKGITLESGIQAHAQYTFREQHPEKYYLLRGVEHYVDKVNMDESWKNALAKKAAEDGITTHEQIVREARWMFNNDYPQWYEKYMIIQKAKSNILSDSSKVQDIKRKSQYYYLKFEEALQIEAEYQSGLFSGQ